MSDNNDELVSQFMAFTGSADASRATSYLEMSGGDLQTAVSLYMEHEQGGSEGGGGAPFGAMGGREAAVRAPDETRRMRLMDDQMAPADPTFQLMNAMMEEQLARTAFAAPSGRVDPRGAVNAAAAQEEAKDADSGGDDNEYMHVDDGDDDEVEVVGPSGPNLTEMFAEPTHIMHTAGGFAGSRAVAKDSKRWLIVNIQRDSEFASHALNRDVWRDELVENLIREGFIFWQQVRQNQDPLFYRI